MIDIRKKNSKRGEAPVDNYAAFKLRLSKASKDLTSRNVSVTGHLQVLKKMLECNTASFYKWDSEFDNVSSIRADYTGGDEGRGTLDDLVDTASRMKTLFTKRMAVLQSQITAIESNRTAICAAIADVNASINKLELSKLLHKDREKLLHAERQLSGFDGAPALTPGHHGLPLELHPAREAVAMAEALLELKGR